MIGVDDSLIDKMNHNLEHSLKQDDDVEATNIAKKLVLEFWGLQNVQSLVCPGNVVRYSIVEDHQEHTFGFVETQNHHANRTYYSHY